MRHAIILAGGSGTRLWPASRKARPKQLLPLGPAGEILLSAAVRRGRAVAGDNVWIVTGAELAQATHAVEPNATILSEPMARNTAAAIGLAAAHLVARDPDATMVILPADQHVRDEAGLTKVLEQGFAAVEADDVIGTVGITPTRAETGFGYLEIDRGATGVTPVKRFVEKPDHATAESYVASGTYLWNAGMFFASAKRLLVELETHLHGTYEAVTAIARGGDAAALYEPLMKISIDHAIMERANRVVTIPASVGWDDVGSWAALADVRGTDNNGNTLAGNAIALDGKGNIISSDDDTLIAAVGVEDLVIVKSGNAILVVPKARAQDVRLIVDWIAKKPQGKEYL